MREGLLRASIILITILVMLGIAEAALRLSPSLIGVAILDRFHPSLRGEIAAELGLSTEADRYILRSSERSDGGPDLFLHRPDRRYVMGVDKADAEVGGIADYFTDAKGFCNPAGLSEKRPMHVLTIGGSIPNCVSITPEDNFTNRLGEYAGVNSYNLAVIGVGPYEYLETLRKFGLSFAPRIVVMALAEGNDLRDVERFLRHKSEGSKKARDKKHWGGPFAVSYALAFLKGGAEVAIKEIGGDDDPNFRYSVIVAGKRTALNVRNGDTGELRLAQRLSSGKISPEIYRESITNFVDLSRKHGFVPLVMMMPAAYTVYVDSILFEDPTIAPIMRKYSDAQRQWLAENVEQLGARYFDATAPMQEAGKTRLLYFPSNVHLTPDGHRALAEALAPQIKALLP